MAAFTLVDAYAYVGGYDFKADTNLLQLSGDVEAKDKTTFGSSGFKEVLGGLRSSDFEMKGLWQSAAVDAPDPQAFANLGASKVITFGPVHVEGQPAYIWQAVETSYKLGDTVGEVAPFDLKAVGADGVGVIRGQLAKARGAVSATGQLGSILDLAAGPSATQFAYATLHVLSAATTITVQLQSDDNIGFASPTTRATFGPITTAGGTWAVRTAGPLAAERYWRLNVSAVTGTFIVAGAIGIQ